MMNLSRFVVAKCLACALLVATSACGLIPYDVDQDLPAQTVPGSAVSGALGGFFANAVPITINIKDEEAKHNTTLIHSATLSLFRLQITPHDAPVGNFDFLNEIHVSIAATGLASQEIARLSPVPKGHTTLVFDTLPVDLLPYINAGAQITATATGSAPAKDTTFDGHITVTLHI